METTPAPAGLQPRMKLWAESGGRLVMSDYRFRLLQLIDELGSLAPAAQAMGLSYRRAWGKVKELEGNLDERLVESEVGGTGGGHSSLTPRARELLAAYARFQSRMADELERAFAEEMAAFADTLDDPAG